MIDLPYSRKVVPETVNLRELRMENYVETPQTAGMEIDYERLELLDHAVELAKKQFDEPTHEHVNCIVERIEWNMERGLFDEGALTIH